MESYVESRVGTRAHLGVGPISFRNISHFGKQQHPPLMVEFAGLIVQIFERNVIKFAPHHALKLIA